MTACATIATATETDWTRILTGNGSERPNTNGRTFTATVNDDPKDAFGREHRIELRGLSLSNQCFRINIEEALELATALLVTAYQSETKKMKPISKRETYYNSRTIGPPKYYGTILRLETRASQLKAMGTPYRYLPWQ